MSGGPLAWVAVGLTLLALAALTWVRATSPTGRLSAGVLLVAALAAEIGAAASFDPVFAWVAVCLLVGQVVLALGLNAREGTP